MKYKIQLAGRGFNTMILQLKDVEFNKIRQSFWDGTLTNEKVEEVLGVPFWELMWESPANKYFYKSLNSLDPEDFYLNIYDDNMEIIIEDHLIDTSQLIDDLDYIVVDEIENLFFINEILKGVFNEYEIETENEIDLEKLVPIIHEYPEDCYTVVGLKYDDKEIIPKGVSDLNGSGNCSFDFTYSDED